MNYKRLMVRNPTSFGTIVNSLGQTIEFFEHPTRGDESFVICVCHELELAQNSTFFDTEDMEDLDSDYVPNFLDGKLYIGDFLAN